MNNPEVEMALIRLAYAHINKEFDDNVTFGSYCDIDHYEKALSKLAWKLQAVCKAAGITELAQNYDLSEFSEELAQILAT